MGLYLDTKSGLSLLCNSVRISSLNHLMALFLHKYLFSWHLLPLTFIQSLSLIHFPKYILDIHPLLFKTIASPYSKILEPLNWPFPSSLPLPLLSPLIFFTLHSEGHFHNTPLRTPQWLPLSYAYESYSWSLTLPTGLCLFFQPHYVPFASLFTVFEPCWFSLSSCLRTFVQAIPLTGMLFLSTFYLTSFRPHFTYIFLSNVFCDPTDHTLNFSCVIFITCVLTLLISVFLGRLHALWEQGACLASSLLGTQRLVIKYLLNE